jgi:hypothetical protein
VTRIRWEDFDPATVERVITALLVRTVEGAKPVEGAGGDEGADVVASMAGGEHVYEIKSFTGRLTASRRGQIVESLRSARDHRPAMRAWTLILPTDLTPGEQRWFHDDLGSEVDVPLTWMGRIELDAAFAERPDLSRNFLPGSAERLAFDMMVQAGQETGALAGGIPDAMRRGADLRMLASKVDPDWDVDLVLASDGTTVNLRPKDPGAFERSMVGGSLQLRVQPGSPEAQALSNFEMFGSPLHLHGDHVSQFAVRLPGQLDTLLATPGEPISLAIDTPPGPGQRLQLVSLRAGAVVRRLPMTLTHNTQGVRGGRRLVLVDDAEVVRMEFLIQPAQDPVTPGEVEFEVAMRPDRHPGDVIPAIEFLVGLQECDGLRLNIPGAPPTPVRLPSSATPGAMAPLTAFLTQLATLRRVQDATGDEFGVPALTPADQDMLYFADQLLTHGYVEWFWPGISLRLPHDQVHAILATAPLLPRLNLTGSGDGAIPIAGHVVNLPGKIIMSVLNAVVVNPAGLHRTINQTARPMSAVVQLGTQDTTQVMFRLEAEVPADDETMTP